jgi:GGDEF domain-containing protein
MEYGRFERLVISSTTALVLLSIAVSIAGGGADKAEIIGQLAIIFVMVAAVHWGRRAGTFAALAACLVYLALRLPLIAAGLTPQALLLIVSRFAGYCLVGIVGGEIFSRVKYLFAGSNDSNMIDDWSRVYNQRYAARAIEQAVARHIRYQEPFSVILVQLEPVLTGTQRPQKLRGLVRTVASFIRDDVRMVDDVARLEDGRFVVLLPHTPGEAAPVVAGRLIEGICRTLGVKENCISTTCLGTESDTAALEELVASIVDAEEESAS